MEDPRKKNKRKHLKPKKPNGFEKSEGLNLKPKKADEEVEIEVEEDIEKEEDINNKTKLNKTKLNNLFIYMINGQKNEENISEDDRIAIIRHLKRLELYFTNIETLNIIPKEKILEYELQYWTIKELHFSPYKIYLNELTRDKFLLKFLQTQKYIKIDSESKLTDFVSYFIKSLREELENGGNKNATN